MISSPSSLQASWLTPRKKAFLTGTLLLTGTGFLCRILGFFYRIFLSRTIGAEGLGIYNMVHPVFGICFSLCAGSLQTALSQYAAANLKKGRNAFYSALAASLSLSLLLAFLVCRFDEPIASRLLLEPRCAPYLPVIALSVPFAALHACINGYYYGMQQSRIPAFSQVAEQVIRMGAVFFIVNSWAESGRAITVSLAVYGHLIGEAASALFCLLSLLFFPPKGEIKARTSFFLSSGFTPVFENMAPLMSLALPLMGSRLVLNLLGSAEAVWIPNRLAASGLSSQEAYSVYGILTGMSLPFIYFPSAITNSVAVLLLPAASQAQADGDAGRISRLISMCLRYSCYMGILCIGIFSMFGLPLGLSVFHSEEAGRFMICLAWLCPFMYLASTLGSVLNGLGKTSVTFGLNVVSMLIRLGFVLFAIPLFGIRGYLWGLLASEIALALLDLLLLRQFALFSWDCFDMLIKPVLFMAIAVGLYFFFAPLLSFGSSFPLFVETGIHIMVICAAYCGLLLLAHLARGKS